MKTNHNSKIGIVEKLGFCSIEVGNQFCWTMVSSYLSIFYTDVVGLTPAIVSIILLVARVWDGVNDPMMGAIAAKTNTKYGKYRPYLIWGAPFVAIFSILTFSKTGASGTTAILYAAITYILCGMAYTVVCISQAALANVMTRDAQTRVQLQSFRQAGNGITGLIISAIAMPMILYFGNGSTSSAKGYFVVNIIFALLGMICVIFGGVVCKERVKSAKDGDSVSVKEIIKYAITNKNVLLLCLNGVCTAGSILGRMGVLSYWFIYYIGKPEMMATVLVCYNFATIVVQFIVPFITKAVGKKKACMASYGLQIISMLILFAGGKTTVILYVGSILLGLSNFAPPILNGFMGAVADADEVEHGRRNDGLIASIQTLGTKIGIALGGSIGVSLLGAAGYVANQEQTAEALMGINAVTNLAPIVFVVIAAICIILIPITPEQEQENRRILEERHREV
ncbi:MAG: MFS transporter [Lachnospiraceae bacterium]